MDCDGLNRTTPNDPELAKLEIQPAPRKLTPNESVEIRVIATYTDGSQRDVTQVTSYQSSDNGIISTKHPGLLMAGHMLAKPLSWHVTWGKSQLGMPL